MTSSHPPTLLTLAARALREECRLGRGERILVAVSGGPDSAALLHVLSRLRKRFGFDLHAHGVDHGLRREAQQELDVAARLAARCEVPFTRSVVSVWSGGNLQARARAARYDALRHAAASAVCSRIATAHHADDRAETVLIRLMRGAGPKGLSVLRAAEGDRIRPLIRARRLDISKHLERHRVESATDPSNSDCRFLRVRVRKEVLPLLEELSPGIVGHLTALADALEQGPVPKLTDATGAFIPLKRAHVNEIRRAMRPGGHRAIIRLPHGRTLRVAPGSGELCLDDSGQVVTRLEGGRIAESDARKTVPRGCRTSRGAKPRKSG